MESYSPIFYPAKFTHHISLKCSSTQITFCACVSNSRISQDVHLELFSSCEAEARFTRSFRPLSELIPLTAIASANVKVLAALEDGEELNK